MTGLQRLIFLHFTIGALHQGSPTFFWMRGTRRIFQFKLSTICFYTPPPQRKNCVCLKVLTLNTIPGSETMMESDPVINFLTSNVLIRRMFHISKCHFYT